MHVHTDLIVASTNQKSWDGTTGTRTTDIAAAVTTPANGNYCDKIRHDATTRTESYTFITTGGASASNAGLAGKNKCTYIYTVDKGQGAPAFKLVKADFMDFQLHFLEYAEIDHKTNGLK